MVVQLCLNEFSFFMKYSKSNEKTEALRKEILFTLILNLLFFYSPIIDKFSMRSPFSETLLSHMQVNPV